MAENIRYNEALKKAMKLCAGREFCRSEIESRLEKWGIQPAEREKILKALQKDKFIDEIRFSTAYARDKFKHNRWGKVKIAMMLKSKGIDEDTIQQAVSSIDEEEYINTLRKLIKTHRKSVRAKNSFELRGKLARFAISRGFEPDIIYQILEEEE